MRMVDQCALGRTIILGDSRAMAGLIPAAMGEDVTNLALGAGTQIENYHTVRRILACPQRGRRVVIAFLPIDISRPQMYWERTALFGFLNFQEMEEVRKVSVRLGDSLIYSSSFIFTIFDVIKNYSYHASFPPYYFPAMMNAGFIGRKARNEIGIDAILQSRGHHYFGKANYSNSLAEDANQRVFSVEPIMEHYLEELLELLRDSKVNVYFVTPPLNPATFEAMSPNVVVGFRRYIADLSARFSNFHVLGEVIYREAADHFGDSEHLNSKGATAWASSVGGLLAEASRKEAVDTGATPQKH